MSRRRLNGTITGDAGVKAHLWDAIGGGLCKIHGEYFGSGKYGMNVCSRCDSDMYFYWEFVQRYDHEAFFYEQIKQQMRIDS